MVCGFIFGVLTTLGVCYTLGCIYLSEREYDEYRKECKCSGCPAEDEYSDDREFS